MALTMNRQVDHYVDQERRTFKIAGSERIYKGALIGLSGGGYARPLMAGDRFVGLAYEEKDNAGGNDGDADVRVYTVGDFRLALSGASQSDVGRPVFASDDETLTFDGGGHSYVGVCQDVPSAGEIILRLDPTQSQVKTATFAVEDLSAGQDISSRAIHAFDHAGWIVGARLVNQDTAASGIDAGNTCAVTVAGDGGTIATATFDDSTPFPATNALIAFGSVSNARVGAGDIVTLSVVNGTTADPGPFLIQIDYV